MRLEPHDRLEGAIARLGKLVGSRQSESDAEGEIRIVLDQLEEAAGAIEQQQDELIRTRARVDHERRRYREMFHFAPAGYLQTDLHDAIQDVNLAASRMLRVEQRRLIGKQLTQFIPVADRKAFRIQLALLHDGQELHGRTAHIQPRDSDPMTVLLDVVPAHNDSGKIVGYRWLIRERTLEPGYADRFRRAHDFLEAAPVGCILVDREWRLRLVNRAASRLMGMPSEQILGKVLWEAFPDAVKTPFADIGHAVMKNGEAFEFEEPYSPSGRWMRGVAFPSPDGLCVFFQDITSARRAQAAETQLAAIVRATSLGVLSLAPNGVVETWNRGAQKLLGYRASEIVGKNVRTLVPHDRAKDLSFLKGRGNDDAQFDSKVLRKDGSLIDVSATVSAMRAASGDLVGYGLIYRPATELARETQKLKVALRRRWEIDEALRKDNHLKDLLLIAASHDMRSPLTSIVGMASTLQTVHPFPVGSDEAQLLDRMIVNAKKLDALLSDLLDLDRIANGYFKAGGSRVDVGEVARSAVLAVGCSPEILSVEGDAVIDGDATLIERIIENLLGNAIKFSGAHEDVRVTIRSDADGVAIIVDDRGPGVPDDMKEDIFEPFTRGETHTDGHGLGLSLVRGFAELHGGRAWVEDRPGGGASFRVSLGSLHAVGGPLAEKV